MIRTLANPVTPPTVAFNCPPCSPPSTAAVNLLAAASPFSPLRDHWAPASSRMKRPRSSNTRTLNVFDSPGFITSSEGKTWTWAIAAPAGALISFSGTGANAALFFFPMA